MKRIWDAGDAFAPIDQRLPTAARVALLQELAPSAIIDANLTETKFPGGRSVEAGDAIVIATSGSSGSPKGVVLTHANIVASATASNNRLGTTSSDHWLACLPLSHVGGLSVITRAWQAKCQLTVHPSFDVSLVEASARSGVTMTSLVATALGRIDATLFRTILLGGSAALEPLPKNVVSTYGLTETGSGIVYDGLPLDNVEIRLSPEGEIQVKAPMLSRCYRDGSPTIDTDGWFCTGDIGEFANDGRLIVHGRRGDLIITGGENVWPQQVEAVLEHHPCIREVIVRGVPDPTWGHQIVAWVTTLDGNAMTLDEVRDWVKDSLPAYCAPKVLYVMTALPRTTSGKIDVHRLPSNKT
jgi:O-succinylbenzoic acid--CoA ligase